MKLISFKAILLLALTGCTGKSLNDLKSGIVIESGEELQVDLSQTLPLISGANYTVTLRNMDPSFQRSVPVLDLTADFKQQESSGGTLQMIIPKGTQTVRPVVVVVDVPELDTQFVDIIFSGQMSASPNLASTLAYETIRYYPGKRLNDYTGAEFELIKSEARKRVDQLFSESEHLSLQGVPYEKISRYLKNGLAYSASFLDAIRPSGVVYTYQTAAPLGLVATSVPGEDLTPYRIPSRFFINGAETRVNPLNVSNNFPRLSLSETFPPPALSIGAREGTRINIRAKAFDLDDDFLDKNMFVQYIPRKIPGNRTRVIPEPQPETMTLTEMSLPNEEDRYESSIIAYNEANTLPLGQKAERNVYYMISDGSMRIPFRWNYEYLDENRPPVIVKNADGKINQTLLDSTLRNNNAFVTLGDGTKWYTHDSHCETDANASVSVSGAENYYQRVKGREDGPWSCTFLVGDPDLEDDPNGTDVSFLYYVGPDTDPFTNILANTHFPANGPNFKIWPPVGTETKINPRKKVGTVVTKAENPNCPFRVCGVGLIQVVIDNAVKVAAESQTDLGFKIEILVSDKPDGSVARHTIERVIEFKPIPPRIIDYGAINHPAPASGEPDLRINLSTKSGVLAKDANGREFNLRKDVKLEELVTLANPDGSNLEEKLNRIGFSSTFVDQRGYYEVSMGPEGNTVTEKQSRFLAPLRSNYQNDIGDVTVASSMVTVAPIPVRSFLTPQLLTQYPRYDSQRRIEGWMVDNVRPFFPRMYDQTCRMFENNISLETDGDPIWSQIAPGNLKTDGKYDDPTKLNQGTIEGGWVGQIDFVDFDNIDLNPSEPFDPVRLESIQHDVDLQTRNPEGILYCHHTQPKDDPFIYKSYKGTCGPVLPGPQIVNGVPFGTGFNAPNYLINSICQDQCNWLENKPEFLQPINIFYTKPGSNEVRKMVYHRLRFKWKPRDQKENRVEYKKGADTVGSLIKNTFRNLSVSGNVYANKRDTRDLNILSLNYSLNNPQKPQTSEEVGTTQNGLPLNKFTPIPLYAIPLETQPCITPLSGLKRNNYFHALHSDSVTTSPLQFSIRDENRNAKPPQGTDDGRYQAQLNLLGNKKIFDESLSLGLLRTRNCTFIMGANDNLVPGSSPLTFYADSNTSVPYSRINSVIGGVDDIGTSLVNRSFCLQSQYEPLVDSQNLPYNGTLIVENKTDQTKSVTLFDGAGYESCLPKTVQIRKKTAWTLVPTNCAHRFNQFVSVSSNIPNFTGATFFEDDDIRVGPLYSFHPKRYGFSDDTPFSFDRIPGLYRVFFDRKFTDANVLALDIYPIDTFKDQKFTDKDKTTPAWYAPPVELGSIKLIPSHSNELGAFSGDNNGGINEPSFSNALVDWDYNPSALSILTPNTSSDLFYRTAPGDATRIQIFSKNLASVSIQFRAQDLQNALSPTLDFFDVFHYSLGAVSGGTPKNAASLDRLNIGNCTNSPADFPQIETLAPNTLEPYRNCSFSWTPALSDSGRRFTYTLNVVDNPSLIGARYPSGGTSSNSAFVPSASDTNRNTTVPIPFSIQLEHIETNAAPSFTTSLGGSINNNLYQTTGGAPGWTQVFSGTNGVAPSNCELANNHILYNTNGAAEELTEGATRSFSITASDSNTTNALKTLSFIKPSFVMRIDSISGGYTCTKITNASIKDLSMTQAANVPDGTGSISFNWTPNDLDAFLLSSPDGFLVPFVVNDQNYAPSSEPGFPTSFTQSSLSTTAWIHMKVRVRNNQPTVFWMDGTTERPLNGSTITLNTSANSTSLRVRVRDSDTARLSAGNEYTSQPFQMSLDVRPAFVTSSTPTMGTQTLSAGTAVQDGTFTIPPLNDSLLGIYAMEVSITDPGDPSRGLVALPASHDGLTATRARLSESNNNLKISFNLQVVGRPVFLAPNASQNQIMAYTTSGMTGRTLTHPTSIFISRPDEFNQNYFIGFQLTNATTADQQRIRTTRTSVINGRTAEGMYVNERHSIRWINPSIAWVETQPTRTATLMAIRSSLCTGGVISVSGATNTCSYLAANSPHRLITRFNETTNSIECCQVPDTRIGTDLATQSISVTLNSELPEPVPALSRVLATRIESSPVFDSSNSVRNASLSFQEFYERCLISGYCGTSISGSLSAINSGPGFLHRTYQTGSSVLSKMCINSNEACDDVGTHAAVKLYSNEAPTSGGILRLQANENETVRFSVQLAQTPSTGKPLQARWYRNGCLIANQSVTTNQISFQYQLNNLSAGRNDECWGQGRGSFSIDETNRNINGLNLFRLNISNGTETLASNTDGASLTYLFQVESLNTDLNIISNSVINQRNIVSMSANNYAGLSGSTIQFAFPLQYQNREFLVYSDLNSSTGIRLRATQLESISDVWTLRTSSPIALTCPNMRSQPLWMAAQVRGIGASSTIRFAASSQDSYPFGDSATGVYGNSSITCYGDSNLTSSSVIANPGTAPAGFLSFATNRQAIKPTAFFTTSGSSYQSSSDDTQFYFVNDRNASRQHWAYAMAPLSSTVPSEFSSPYQNSRVRKNIIHQNILFQLSGANSQSATNWIGSIRALQLQTNNTSLNESAISTIRFDANSASASDCKFNGTPLDGIYISRRDQLIVLAQSQDSSGNGKLISIDLASTGSATCRILGDVLNPSLNTTDHQPNLSKMVFDADRGLIYGIITTNAGQSSQIFTYDAFGERIASVRAIPASIVPHSIHFMPESRSLFLLDGRRTSSSFPILYRVW